MPGHLMRWLTPDGLWRVTALTLESGQVLRVETRGALGWVHRGDAASADEVAALVPGFSALELQEAAS